MQSIMTCLWFDSQAEDAARSYVSLIPDSKIVHVAHYGDAGADLSGRPKGTVMTVIFELNGQRFMALNGGPHFPLTPAISLVVNCETQQEIDALWTKLSADPAAERCGWLKDKYGLSWQIVPTIIADLMKDSTPGQANRVMQAVLKMKKIDIAELERVAAAT